MHRRWTHRDPPPENRAMARPKTTDEPGPTWTEKGPVGDMPLAVRQVPEVVGLVAEAQVTGGEHVDLSKDRTQVRTRYVRSPGPGERCGKMEVVDGCFRR